LKDGVAFYRKISLHAHPDGTNASKTGDLIKPACETPKRRGTFQNPVGFHLICGSMAIIVGLSSLTYFTIAIFSVDFTMVDITPINN
jgi:hypothetical protein